MLGRVLRGRAAECARLDELLDAARGGGGGALVARGEAGTGKPALLDSVAERPAGARALRAGGVGGEMELPFAALHQICLPLLGYVEPLPPPQRDSLRTAFGLSSGSSP